MLSAFEMCHPLQACWLLCICGWWWLLPGHFGFSSRGFQSSSCWILSLARENSVSSFPSQLLLCLSMVLLAPGELCQHILFLHTGKWQPCDEIGAGKRAVQWVVHSALRAGEYIKQHCVQHPWALLGSGSLFPSAYNSSISAVCRDLSTFALGCLSEISPSILSLAEQSASDGVFRHLFWERAL